MKKANYITEITVTDPDTNAPVEVVIYKDVRSAGMFGVDASFLLTDEAVHEPFDGQEVVLFDDDIIPATTKQTFNATRMALAAAVGDYIDEPDMSIDEVFDTLNKWGSFDPQINVLEPHRGISGIKLAKEINLTAQGYRGLMEIAYNAAKLNQELI